MGVGAKSASLGHAMPLNLDKLPGILIASCLALLVGCSREEGFVRPLPTEPVGPPVLTLDLDEFNPSSGIVMLTLVVSNKNTTSLVLTHLTNGLIESHGAWGGWCLNMQGNGKRFAHPTRRFVLDNDCLIELAPSERFAVEINAAAAIWDTPEARDYEKRISVLDEGGEFRADIEYRFEYAFADRIDRNDVWVGAVTSNPIFFSIP